MKKETVSKLYSGLDTEVEDGFDNSGAGGFSSFSLVPERNGQWVTLKLRFPRSYNVSSNKHTTPQPQYPKNKKIKRKREGVVEYQEVESGSVP